MSRRLPPRGPLTPRQRPQRRRYRLDDTTWAMRVIVILAVAIVVTGIVYAAVNGVLFRTTGSP